MKRVTFVFIGIIAITSFVLLSRKEVNNKTDSIVKTDVKKHKLKHIE